MDRIASPVGYMSPPALQHASPHRLLSRHYFQKSISQLENLHKDQLLLLIFVVVSWIDGISAGYQMKYSILFT